MYMNPVISTQAQNWMAGCYVTKGLSCDVTHPLWRHRHCVTSQERHGNAYDVINWKKQKSSVLDSVC